MTDRQLVFRTAAFVDSADVLAQNVNGIAGHALATWLVGELRNRKLDASEVWAEDHGWDFSLVYGGAKYLCACAISDDEPPAREGQVIVHKSRTMMERLTGKGKMAPDDAVAEAVQAALLGRRDVTGLRVE